MTKTFTESNRVTSHDCAICQTGSTVEKFVAPGINNQLNGKLCLACKEKVNQYFLAETQNPNIVGAMIWGVLAAVVGSAAWYLVAIWTGLEISYVAIALGLWLGLAVHLGSGKKKGRRLQIICLILTFLAIIMAKKLLVDEPIFSLEFWRGVISIKGLFISFIGLVVAFVICAPRKLK